MKHICQQLIRAAQAEPGKGQGCACGQQATPGLVPNCMVPACPATHLFLLILRAGILGILVLGAAATLLLIAAERPSVAAVIRVVIVIRLDIRGLERTAAGKQLHSRWGATGAGGRWEMGGRSSEQG